MEKEFGISCQSSLPKEQHQLDLLDQERQESAAGDTVQSHQEEQERSQSSIAQVEERSKVGQAQLSAGKKKKQSTL